MSTPVAALLLLVGIAVLAAGADLLVRGAVTIARAARISTAVIGLTVVAMGTSLPELTVSLSAALRGSADISLGSVVGSNIFNICVVVGLSALILPMRVHGSAVRTEWPFMLLASFLLLLLARDGRIDQLEGLFFVVGLALFTAYIVRVSPTEVRGEEAADLRETVERKAPPVGWRSIGGAAVLVASGSLLLIGGGELLVRGAVELARASGMTERVIGLTVVAAGTGAPELATSLMAARRGQSEIALANVIGSNILNVLGILGVTAIVTPLAVAPAMISSDLWWMLGVSFALFPVMRSRLVVTRIEGGLLLVTYLVYTALLVRAG